MAVAVADAREGILGPCGMRLFGRDLLWCSSILVRAILICGSGKGTDCECSALPLDIVRALGSMALLTAASVYRLAYLLVHQFKVY